MNTEARHPSTLPSRLLHNHNFILLWCAYAVSAMGDHLSEMAILKTQNILAVDVDVLPLAARMDFTMFLPFLLMAPFAGVLADRFPRRGLMVIADLVRMGVFLVFASLIAWTQDWGKWGGFLPLLPIGMMAAVFSPARAALLPTLLRTDQLVRANAMISGLGIMATMAAAVAGGYLADNYAPTLAFRLNAVTFLVSAVLLLAMKPPPHVQVKADGRARPGVVRNLMEGFVYVKSHRRVFQLIVIAMIIWFCGALVKSVVPSIAVNVYAGSYKTISFYYAMIGGGFVAGALTMTAVGNSVRGYIPMTLGLWGVAMGMLLLAASVFLPLDVPWRQRIGACGLFAGGFFAVTTMACFNALLQRIVPDRYRGRVFGVKDVAAIGSLLLATGSLAIPNWTNLDAWSGYILVGVAVMTLSAGTAVFLARMKTAPMSALLTLTYDLNEFVVKFWWRGRRWGPCTVPRNGPVIITANHRCPADPCFLGMGMNYRPISFIIAAEYCKLPVVKYLVWLLKCIPVKRDGSDAGATKQALRHLKAGQIMGIFIEGGIVEPGEEPRPKDGIAMLALRSGAAVVPVHISGTLYREGVLIGLLTRHRMRIRFGKPVDLSEFGIARGDRSAVHAATQKIYNSILALAPNNDDEEGNR